MKKTNLVLATLLAGVLGFGSTAAIAQGGGDGERSWKHQSGKHHGGKHGKRGGRHGGGKHMMKRMARKLDLDDTQKAELKTFRESQKAANQELRKEMKDLRTAMRSLDRTVITDVENMAERKADLTKKMFMAKNASRLAFEQLLERILTDEQKAKMAEMKAKRQAHMQERMEKRKARKAARDAENDS